MAKTQTQAKTPTPAQTIAANAAAQMPTTLAQADMVAVAHKAHGHGPLHTAYHGGNSACLSKTQVPTVAANMVRAFLTKYPNAKVVATGVPTTWGSRGKPGGKRATIVAAILAGGSLATIVAVAKANGASFSGLADVVAAVWQGVITLQK